MRTTVGEPAESDSLANLAESWLAQGSRWLTPSLPPRLLALYEAEKGPLRYRSDVTMCAVGIPLAAVFYVLLHGSQRHATPVFDRLYLGVLVPALVLSLIVVMCRPKPMLRELALGVPTLVALAVLTYLNIVASADGGMLYVAAALMLMLLATISVHLRFDLAVGWVLAAQIMFAVGVSGAYAGAPTVGKYFQYELMLIYVTSGAYMLLANRRMHAEQQRGFAFALREQTRRNDLTAQNRTLDEMTRRDALTGLANRRAYDSWLQALWAEAASCGLSTVGLIMVDVDHFKSYNDFYGHPAGDGCLATVGTSLREQLRGTSDQVARIGGEEFAVLLPGVALAQCADIAERLRLAIAAMELPHLGHAADQVVTISCGCAAVKVQGAQPKDLCAAADASFYQAKQTGRNRVCLGELALHAQAGTHSPAAA
jgi:diguanylate cyclase (GGDEF)-like protein